MGQDTQRDTGETERSSYRAKRLMLSENLEWRSPTRERGKMRYSVRSLCCIVRYFQL